MLAWCQHLDNLCLLSRLKRFCLNVAALKCCLSKSVANCILNRKLTLEEMPFEIAEKWTSGNFVAEDN
jgi:hypothetical protein